MTKRPEIAALIAAGVLFAHPAPAQPNLPPPPPPPIDQSPELPSLPPPPPRQTAPSQSPPPSTPPPPPRRTSAPPPPPPYRASVRARRADDEVIYVEPPAAHPVAVTLNPVGLFRGRLSANLEVQLQPHHSLYVSPNVLAFHADRDAGSLVSNGFGFATRTSSSFGLEFGYHYWWHWARTLSGPFIGPALLLGSTTDASVGDPTRAQSYWGLAFDVGWQEVLPGGFTAGVGGGLETLRMAGSGAVVPRLLLQMGWSF